MAVEKLAYSEFAKIGSRQEALQTIFPSLPDICYHPIFAFFPSGQLRLPLSFEKLFKFTSQLWNCLGKKHGISSCSNDCRMLTQACFPIDVDNISNEVGLVKSV